jgi:hypothetical protein
MNEKCNRLAKDIMHDLIKMDRADIFKSALVKRHNNREFRGKIVIRLNAAKQNLRKLQNEPTGISR